ncbi:MAG: cytochrome c [Microthrixaceae bacterium]
MPYGYSSDPDLDRSTNRVMLWGVLLLLAMVLVFPLYLNFEPDSREESRAENQASLASQGETIWEANCSSCHGVDGEGVSAPALNAKQFLQTATDEQIFHLVSVGVPGSAMSAFGQDFAGPLTSEQVEAVTAYIRAWEKEAPDMPDWRTVGQG